MDMEKMLNTIVVPDNAGEYEDGLRKIMSRIPDGWGRWISCDKGWYALICELDEKLADICPDYEVHQVKEKFGTLRYYIGLPELKTQCEMDVIALRPCAGAMNPRFVEGRTAIQQYELDKWFYEKYLPLFDTELFIQQDRDLDPEREKRNRLYRDMEIVINEYENKSSVTCELTGTPGVMMRSNYWYKTLNPEHAPEGYKIIKEEDNE